MKNGRRTTYHRLKKDKNNDVMGSNLKQQNHQGKSKKTTLKHSQM